MLGTPRLTAQLSYEELGVHSAPPSGVATACVTA
jgi:hypothetical protein